MFMEDDFVKSKRYHKYPAAYFELRLEGKEIEEAGGFMENLFSCLWIEEHLQYKQLITIEPKMTEEECKKKEFDEFERFAIDKGLIISKIAIETV